MGWFVDLQTKALNMCEKQMTSFAINKFKKINPAFERQGLFSRANRHHKR